MGWNLEVKTTSSCNNW